MSSITPACTASVAVQGGIDALDGVVYVASRPENVLWGRLPIGADAPVASIVPGARLVVDTVSHEGLMEDQGGDPVAYFGRHGVAASDILDDAIDIARTVTHDAEQDGPHIVTGPIRVAGAKRGDLLSVRIDALQPRTSYGVISTRHGRGVLTGDDTLEGTYSQFVPVDPHTGTTASIPLSFDADAGSAVFALAPFLGVIGVAADADIRPNSIPPAVYGGNIDVKLFVVGSTVYLPVQVDGALLYIGDPHFAQGDGEVALTALEAPLRATLTVDLIRAEEVADVLPGVVGPFGAVNGCLVPLGLSEDLDEALRLCVANAVELLASLFGMDRRLAYLYLSAAADFRISQAVDIVKGVHGVIRVDDFSRTADNSVARRIVGSAR